MLSTDPITGAPRLLAPHRARRLAPRVEGCPFCAGNEDATPTEVDRVATADADDPVHVREAGWRARAFPNLFPLGDVHEVLVPTPRHATSMRELDAAERRWAVELWLRRRRTLRDVATASGRYLHLFVNDGRGAGASLEHVHAQLVAIPRTADVDDLVRNVRQIDDCALCAIAEDELEIDASPRLRLSAHPAPRMGGALLLAPLEHGCDPAAVPLEELAWMLGRAIAALPDGCDFNAWLVADEAASAHWYLELVPRTAHLAGLELATGIGVSIIEPARAADEARARLPAGALHHESGDGVGLLD